MNQLDTERDGFYHEDREAKYPAQPAGEAAARVRAKIARNMIR